MKTKFYGVVVAATLAIGLLALPVISAGQDTSQDAEETGSLDELLRQRRDTLQQLVEVVTEEYRIGTKSFNSVVQAKDRLIDAELELADSRQERLALLQQQVEMFEAFSAMTDERFALGQVPQSDRLAVRAAFLDAKIKLARERERDGEAAN